MTYNMFLVKFDSHILLKYKVINTNIRNYSNLHFILQMVFIDVCHSSICLLALCLLRNVGK